MICSRGSLGGNRFVERGHAGTVDKSWSFRCAVSWKELRDDLGREQDENEDARGTERKAKKEEEEKKMKACVCEREREKGEKEKKKRKKERN